MNDEQRSTSMRQESKRHALIFGASGLVGRHLALQLAGAGASVTAAVRSVESGRKLSAWLANRGLTAEIALAAVDFDGEEILAGGSAKWQHITEIHNCAGVYRFGMTPHEARTANVGIVERVLDFAAGLSQLTRVVHISGYRVGGQDPASVPWSDDERQKRYAKLGSYEASKVESDAIFQARATELDVPWTIVNPSSVIGDSETGESDQQIGLADTIAQLWRGSTPALPGGDATFLPVVTVDYLARFMREVAADPNAIGQSYWVLDADTPMLPKLLADTGRHIGARVPRLRIPTAVITRLPRWITKADLETLTFLSADRYPTQSAEEFASRHGMRMPEVDVSMARWADYLVAQRFGAAPSEERRLSQIGGIGTFELGVRESHRVILPGLPVNADTWAAVAAATRARALDLPGLGLSRGSGMSDWQNWLPGVLGEVPTHLVGHSIGAAAAVIAAAQHPAQVASLTLVAPFFLQSPTRIATWQRPLIRAALKHMSAEQFSLRLTGSRQHADALETSVQDLQRSSATHALDHLVQAGSEAWRRDLREQLRAFTGPVRIITGSEDPLLPVFVRDLGKEPNVELHVIAGAGHHPQLTHGQEVAKLIAQ
ncbi:alpha/beta fold hydrolase [Leucobacter sp. 1207-22]|uniref:alpha/beta fold hydrolase n=1 Tax=Leucobacter sp. 1207-22 TaxID=2604456 RepID=UPI004063F47C